MAKARDTGSIVQWNEEIGKGLIHGPKNTWITCSGMDVMCQDMIKVGDQVSFVTIKDNGNLKATDIRKTYSHNNVHSNNRSNKPQPRAQPPKHGIVYFQKAWYTKSQMTHIAHKFKNHLARAPRVLFSDNYRDYQRKSHEKRLNTGPQATVVAPYDRSFGFAIPTRFKDAKALGFVNNDHNFNTLIRHLFTKLEKHLRSGGDVIIPAPSDKELKDYKFKAINKFGAKYYQNRKQVIFHNIGTAMLPMSKLLFIQKRIDELRLVASTWKAVKGEVNYHNYAPPHTEVTQVPQVSQVGNRRTNTNPNSNGRLVFQTSWYDKTQLQRIDAEYEADYTSAPRFLFGDNNQDKERQNWKSRQMFGGQAGVVGKYDRTIGYGIVTTFFGASTPTIYAYKRLMDQQFKPLADHLRKGCDVIVPTPTSKDINKNRRRYNDYRTGKQAIFHNLGTGIASLSMEHIKYIQTKIDELKKIARKIEYAEYYNYDPKSRQLLSRKRPPYRAANIPKEEPYVNKKKNDPPMQYAQPQPQATSVAHQQMIDQREWQCNLCGVICQGHQKNCNQCHAPKGAKKQPQIAPAYLPNQNQPQWQPQPQSHSQPSQARSAPNTNEFQKLHNQIAELKTDLQTAKVQLQQQVEMQKKEKDKVAMLQTQLKSKEDASKVQLSMITRMQNQIKLKEDESNQIDRLQTERHYAKEEAQMKQSKLLEQIHQLKQQNSELESKFDGQERVWKEQEESEISRLSATVKRLQTERDNARQEDAKINPSKLLEYMEQINQLRKQNSELQSKVHELEIRKVKEESELSATVKRLEAEVHRKDTKIQLLHHVNDLSKTLQRNENHDIADEGFKNKKPDAVDMNDRRLMIKVQKKGKKANENDPNENDDDDLKEWIPVTETCGMDDNNSIVKPPHDDHNNDDDDGDVMMDTIQ